MTAFTTDNAWCRIGEEAPYFGVLTQPRYRKKQIPDADLNDFFLSGEHYVEETLATARDRLGAPYRFERALDFGCGVGRLTLPLAGRSGRVLGVDVSPAMLREARQNATRQNIQNVEFALSGEWTTGEHRVFDFVHTYIVLQHISTARGLSITRKLIEVTAPGGFGVIHLTYDKSSAKRKWMHRVRKYVPLVNNAINVLRGRPLFTPMMQMNDYNMNNVLRLFQGSGVTDMHLRFTDHGGHLGVSLCYRKP